MALVLAMDVSISVDAREDALQRQGLANALLAQDVQDAFFVSPDPVALAIFEWSGRFSQSEILDWTLIETPEDLEDASERVSTSVRQYTDDPTALGHALGYASLLLRDAPDCLFKTIDVSGDGESNDGFPPSSAFAAFPFEGVTVNGLAIRTDAEGEPFHLPTYYETEVIRGAGAFIEEAAGFVDFENAMERKLVRELQALAIGWLAPADQ